MEYTKNYKLPQWVESDRIMMEDFNQAMADIDAGISKALTMAEEGQQALTESINSISAALGSGGQNARIAWGNYVGNGKYGSSNPTSLTVDFKPVAIFISEVDSDGNSSIGTFLLRSQPKAISTSSTTLTVSWLDRAVRWYGTVSYGQMNTNQASYYWVAIGVDE